MMRNSSEVLLLTVIFIQAISQSVENVAIRILGAFAGVAVALTSRLEPTIVFIQSEGGVIVRIENGGNGHVPIYFRVDPGDAEFVRYRGEFILVREGTVYAYSSLCGLRSRRAVVHYTPQPRLAPPREEEKT